MTAERNLARAAIAAIFAAFVVLVGGLQSVAVAAPNIVINQPLQGSFTNNQKPIFTGTTDDTLDAPVTVKIYAGASAEGIPVESPVALLLILGSWETTPESPLEQRQYTAVAEQTNAVPETGTSTPVTFTVDTAPPVVSMNPVASPTNDATPALTGGAGIAVGDKPPVTVTIYQGSVVGGTVAASETVAASGGAWSYTTPHLGDGTYTAQATQKDEAGNEGISVPVTFTVDTTPPEVTMSSVVSPTNDSTPTLKGTAGTAEGDNPAVTVTVYHGNVVGGAVVGSETVAASGGAWSYTTPHLGDGTYTAQASQSDEVGNTGKSEPPVTFTVDTTQPIVSMNPVASPTNNATPTLTGGTGTAVGDRPPVTVMIYKGGTAGGVVVASGEASLNGTEWSYTPPHLGDGTYTAQAEQSDEAGNTGKSEPAVMFTVDTTPPVVSINPVASPTNNATPMLGGGAGTAEGDNTTVAVTVYRGALAGGTVAASGSVPVDTGKWSFTPPHLSDGMYTVQATQGDAAGNAGKSSAVTFRVDRTPPVVSLNPIASPTSDTTPTFEGGAGTAEGDNTTVAVTVYRGALAGGTVAASGSVPVSGEAWSYAPSSKLSDGTYTVQATQGDAAGNTGKSSAVTFTVDTAAPMVTLNQPVSPSNDTTPSFSGTASDTTLVTVQIYAAGKVVSEATATGTGGGWISGSASPALKDGQYTATATQTSSLGNHFGVTAPVTFTVDTTSPHVTLTSPAEGSSTTSGSQLVEGSAGTAEGDLPGITVQLFQGSSTGQTPQESILVNALTGAWSTTFGGLSPGVYTLRAEQSDDVGNVGLSNTTTFTVLAPAPVTPTPITSPPVQPSPTASPPARQPSTATSTPSPPPPRTMLPFPIVRIAGSIDAAGAKLSLLTVQAPGGAHIAIRCRGRGCPKTESRVVASRSAAGTTLVEFRRFERSLRAGAVLEIRVSMGDEIGKYTRFTIRRGKPPARVDTCLSPTGITPMVCPSS
ncbi:MAG: Ig-like domain-containing protein [Solirubrobacterales bacterium]